MTSEQQENNGCVLYGYYRSSTSWRIRIVLNLKGISYRTVPVNLLKNEQSSAEYLKINKAGAVPTLRINDECLHESMAIAEYLEELYPQVSLLPKSPLHRAKVREVCEIINSSIHPLQNARVLKEIETKYQGDRLEWGRLWNEKGLRVLENILAETHGKFCFGDNVTLADAFLVPQFKGAVSRLGVNESDFPVLRGIVNELQTIKAFMDAVPEHQIDCPTN